MGGIGPESIAYQVQYDYHTEAPKMDSRLHNSLLQLLGLA